MSVAQSDLAGVATRVTDAVWSPRIREGRALLRLALPIALVALVNMGAAVTNINILARGQTVFWRDISFGGNQFTEALQREFNLAFDQAEALKRGQSVDRYSPADARPVLDVVSGEMAGEIQKTFDFFAATSAEGPVDELVVSGGCALTPNLLQILRERFGVPVELLDPFRRVPALGGTDARSHGGPRHPQGRGVSA